MSENLTTVVQQFEDGTQVPQAGFANFTGGGGSGVSSFNTRTGAVTLTAADVDAVGAITNNTSGNAATATTATTATTANGVSAGSTVATPNITGVTNASSATAGSVGEFVQTLVASGSAVTVSGTTTVASISLTAGDWDVEGNINGFDTSALTAMTGSINTSVAQSTDGSQVGPAPFSTTTFGAISLPRKRVNVSVTTTVYLVVNCSHVGTCTAFGQISARRVR